MKCLLLSLLLILTISVPATGQVSSGLVEVSGTVFNQSGEVVPGAKIILRKQDGTIVQTTIANAVGAFRLARVASGSYELEVQKEAFKPSVVHLTIGSRAPVPLRIVLAIAELRDEITVDNQSVQANTNPAENLDVIKLDPDAIKKLPSLGNDVIGTVASLLDAGSVGSGGPTIIVDGLESKKKKVPASQIQEIRINQNPYSAEFFRPGRGRIEVITKPGSSEYHGEFNFALRDYRLDARNAFARERPPEQRRLYEGNLSGPVGRGKKTTFLFGVNREDEDLQAIVFAHTPSGIVAENVANPSRDTEVAFRLNHQAGEKTTFSLRYEFTFDSTKNDGVGGFNLPEMATNSSGRDHELYFTHRRIISSKLINEFTLRVGNESRLMRGTRLGVPRIIVQDAFTGGGSQADRRATENTLQLNEILSWTHGKHFVRGGLNIPNISRHGLSDRANFGGTFNFATLEDYLNNRPFLFSINQGNSSLVFWQKELSLFVQDNILVRPNFSIGVGLRYDKQNYLEDNNNLAPRISFAYAPGKQRKTVWRGGAGIFYDRTGTGPISDRLRFDGQRLRQVLISNPGYPDPFAAGGTLATQPISIVRFASGLRSPYTLQFNLGIERQLSKSLTATANYINTRGIKLFRSRNINAPFAPSLPLPDPAIGMLRQVESSARSQAHALELMLRGRLSRFFNGTVQYTLGRAYNNAGGINSLPANNYDLMGEWSRAEFDERHRFNVLGTINVRDWFDLGMTISLTSGRPYTLTTGRDDNRDTVANDRPTGVRRNSLQGPGGATLDLRWSKEVFLKPAKKGAKQEEGPAATVGLSVFNVLNRVNYAGYVGNLSSPFFGLPVAARPARRVQLNFSFNF